MNKQSGFTITELMVGLSLSLILAFAVGTVYSQTRQTMRLQTSQTRLLEQGRYAIAVFNKMGTQAGYRNATNLTSKNVDIFSGASSVLWENASKEVNFRFNGYTASETAGMVLCDGMDATAASTPAGASGVYTAKLYRSGNALMCNYGTTASASLTTTLLDDNVVDFRVIYGEDDFVATSTMKSDGIPNAYKSASSVSAAPATGPGGWAQVYSARMCIILRGDAINGNAQESAQTYVGCDGSNVTAPDRRPYRRFDTTTYLRNRFD